MHIGKQYKLVEFLIWTRRDIYWLLGLAAIPTTLYAVLGWKWIAIPWVPIAVIGTAAAFIIGFKNTQTYNRLWEARQIWGAIVNTSRSWGILSRDFVKADASVHSELMLRHCAWLTALRYQLRETRGWENTNKPHFKEYRKFYSIPEWETPLEDELKKYLPESELAYVLSKKNRATQLIAIQSKRLKELRERNQIAEFEYVELAQTLSNLYEQQGKCERIKNFPYPRQFASLTMFFVWLFVFLLPLGMLNEFAKIGPECVWFAIPFSTVVSWVFTSMDRVGEATENPFEGSANDIPMASLSRTIEIDLRDMLDEENLPPPIAAKNNIVL
ncbi:multidrug transporter [Flavobacterium sp. MAH-1]|uniref:Multidrug transporter n=1 Tax=Flavobacterium agri TaxID=2743471 RepID=A0A7Y9C4E9_9FLAO|nr:bestrophin family ion channel [Flavobacterium agri]NUY79815.1 multidrug transporter [Flavobacterium agri]NYA69840.1 multidrug transporter [Flavobacterium agri]